MQLEEYDGSSHWYTGLHPTFTAAGKINYIGDPYNHDEAADRSDTAKAHIKGTLPHFAQHLDELFALQHIYPSEKSMNYPATRTPAARKMTACAFSY